MVDRAYPQVDGSIANGDASIFFFEKNPLNFQNRFSKIDPQVRIQDLVKGGAPASEAESCRHSEAESRERSEHSVAGVQGLLKGPGSFWVFDAQICILTHSRDSFSLIFDIYFDTKS